MRNSSESANQGENGVYTLKSGPLEATIDANAGARITSFKFEGTEILTQSDVHPQNYGSTFWDSPQSNWNWPPRATLDSEPYEPKASQDGTEVLMTSSKDEDSGLLFTKSFAFLEGPTRLEATYTIKNVGEEVVEVSPWEVTRVAGGLTVFPLDSSVNQADLPEALLPDFTVEDDLGVYSFNAENLPKGKKSYFAGKEGWMANVTPSGLVFIKKFADTEPGQYAPGHAEVELYGNDLGSYIELENQGAYVTLEPEQSTEYKTEWSVIKPSESTDLKSPTEIAALVRGQ